MNHCRGQVGTSTGKWCTEEICEIKAHAKKKDPAVKEGYVFIMVPVIGTRKNAAFSSAGRGLPKEAFAADLHQLQSQLKTPEEWEVLFKTYEYEFKLASREKEVITFDQGAKRKLDKDMEQAVFRHTLPTPLKPTAQLWFSDGALEEEERISKSELSMIRLDINKVEPLIVDGSLLEQELASVVQATRERVNLAAKHMENLKENCVDDVSALKNSIHRLEKVIFQVDGKLVHLGVALGSKPGWVARDVISAWDAISELVGPEGELGKRRLKDEAQDAGLQRKVQQALAHLSSLDTLVKKFEVRLETDSKLAPAVAAATVASAKAATFEIHATAAIKNQIVPEV